MKNRIKREMRIFLNNVLVRTTTCSYADNSDPQEELTKLAESFKNSDSFSKLLNMPEWDRLEVNHDGVWYTYNK